jgi:hypothetical protein
MDEPSSHDISDTSRWLSLCVLILPISVLIFILVASAWTLTFGSYWFFGALIVLVVALAIIGIPLTVDAEYRARVFSRLRRSSPLPESNPDSGEITWEASYSTQLWPTIRSSDGKLVAPEPTFQFSNTPMLSIDVIKQRLPTLEEMVTELNTHVNAGSVLYESTVATQEQLLIERNAANHLLNSLKDQHKKNTITAQYYRQKRQNLLRTLERIDKVLEQSFKNAANKTPL